ncbi:MAG: hypothetical protein AAGC54_03830 [Cyanobacteria bacterium P01_F01_bin.4]
MKKLSPLKALLKPALAAFKAPYGIAVLASVGVHGVLFAFGPNNQMSLASFGDPNGPGEERTVPLVQLSSAEQSRLPNFSRSRFPSTFSTAGRLPTPSTLPPIARTPAQSSLGRRTQPSTTPRTATRRPAPAPRSGWTAYSSPTTPFFTGPLSLPVLPTPSQSRGAASSNPQNNTMLGATRPSTTSDPEQLTDEDKIRIQRELEEQDAANQAAEQAEDTEASQSTESTEAAEPTEAEKIALSLGASGGGRPPVEGADIVDADAENPDAEASETEVAAASAEEQSRLEQLRAQFSFNPEGTSADAAEAARGDWLAQAEAQAGEAELQVVDSASIPIDYTPRICDEAPTNGLVGVVVAPDGSLAGDPQILKSTGYADLNNGAVGAVLNTPFEPSDSAIAYEFSVEVNYSTENCVDPSQVLQTAGE